jgi:cation:H+ antiporter
MEGEIWQFVVSAIVIAIAGTILAKRADEIAEVTKLGRLVVGSVLLAGVTSLPELTVDITAVRAGLADIAVGDLLGSCLMNLLILALLDLCQNRQGKLLSRTAAAHALGGLLSVGLLALAGLALLVVRQTPQATLGGIHLFLWGIGIVYLFGVRLVFLDQRIAVRSDADALGKSVADVASPPASLNRPWWRIGGEFVLAALAVIVAGPWLAKSAGQISESSGLGGTFVGTTLVAFSTSLPELVASIAALRLGAIDLAVGNVFGSNAFNVLLLLPLELAAPGNLLVDASPIHVVSVFAAILATSTVLIGQLYQSNRRIPIIEPDAWLVIVVVVGALALLHQLA